MINTIIGPVIGGFIAGAIGISVVFLQNYMRKKKERALIVNELLAEIEDNLKIYEDPMGTEMWWMVKYKTDAYKSYKGKFGFLSEEVHKNLRDIAHKVEGFNTAVDVQLWRSGSGVAAPHEFRRIKNPANLGKWLRFCRDELQKWQNKNETKGRQVGKH